MIFETYLRQFQRALDDEISAVRSSGGQKTYVSDGRYLGRRGDLHIYSFTADTELRFPDDTPVDLEYRGRKHTGLILSIDGFDLILAMQDHIGESIPTAVLYTAPWFLLVELQKRLEGLAQLPPSNRVLVDRLLWGTSQAHTPDLDGARKLLRAVEARLGTRIACDEHQLRAIGQVLANDITFIWGPPGTGKTRTLGMTVAALVEAGESVLVVAHSNVAVDVAMLSVAKNLQGSSAYRDGLVLRYGVTYLPELDDFPQLHVRGVLRQQNPELIAEIERLEKQRRELVRHSRAENLSSTERQRIKDAIAEVKRDLEPLRELLRQKEAELIRRASVIGCTLSKATISPEVYERRFDAALVDEVSMAYIPHCAFVSGLAQQRVAVFGDFRQLAPISQADTTFSRLWLQRDVFDQAGVTEKVNSGQTDDRVVLLATQYRMHPAISAVPNHLFYDGRLRDDSEVTQNTAPIVLKPPGPGSALVFHDLTALSAYCFSEPESYSRFNLISALAAAELAHLCVQMGHEHTGVVTPYNAQSRLIHRLLKDLDLLGQQVRVATVHRFQGSECDLIVFDAVEGPPKKPGKLVIGGVDSTAMRLANVAISRAKGKFVAVVNYDYIRTCLDPQDSFSRLIVHVADHTPVEALTWPRHATHGFWQLGLPGLDYFPHSHAAVQQIESDLSQAREEIAISWPTALADFHFSSHVLRRCDPSRVRFFITGQGSKHFHIGLQNARIWREPSRAPMGLVGIDRKRLWVYVDPESPAGPVLRLDFPQTVKLLYAFLRLVPEEEARQDTLEEKLEKGKSPVGLPCPQCGSPLWPKTGRYGPYLACTRDCGYTKRITPTDATNLARLMGIVCGRCGGQVQGRKSYRGVFLGCVNYPACSWTMALEDIV